jgi:ribosomal protein S18 acetylase RimI-like enzyme
LNDLHITPPGVDIADKYYVGFFNGEEMVAVLDLIDGYPEPAIGYIGFFMMNAALQGKQIGSAIIQDVCSYLKQIGKTAIRLGIAKDNPQANHFWKKNSFTVIKEVERDGWTILVAEKKL